MNPTWTLAALLGLAGCDELELPVCLHERFADLSQWHTVALADTVPDTVRPGEITIANGTLVIAPEPRNINLVVESAAFDLRGGFAEVELISSPNVASNVVQQEFGIGIGTAYELRIINGNGGYYFKHSAPGVAPTDSGAVAIPAPRYLRFLHDAAAGTVAYQTSLDHLTWTTQQAPQTTGFAADALHVFLAVVTFNGGTAAGTAAFDNVVVAAPACDPHDLGPHAP